MIRIYVGSYAGYNAGVLDGLWLDLPMDDTEMWDAIRSHCVDGAEEFFIMDTDCDYNFGIDEYDSIDHVNEMAEALEVFSDDEAEAICEVFEAGYASSLENAIDMMDRGEIIDHGNVTLEEYAEIFAEECGMIDYDSRLSYYIDWAAFARDMDIEGNFIEAESGNLIEVVY